MCWLAENDPNKIEGYEKMPLLAYFSVLDSKIAENKKALANAKAAQAKK